MPVFRIQFVDDFPVIGTYDEAPDAPPGGRVDELPRMPEVGEDWDVGTGAFVLAVDIAADMAVGPAHIEKMRRLKYQEAVIILSGYELTTGLLFNEAAIRGITLGEMADLVMDRVEEDGEIAKELARMEQKAGA